MTIREVEGPPVLVARSASGPRDGEYCRDDLLCVSSAIDGVEQIADGAERLERMAQVGGTVDRMPIALVLEYLNST